MNTRCAVVIQLYEDDVHDFGTASFLTWTTAGSMRAKSTAAHKKHGRAHEQARLWMAGITRVLMGSNRATKSSQLEDRSHAQCERVRTMNGSDSVRESSARSMSLN